MQRIINMYVHIYLLWLIKIDWILMSFILFKSKYRVGGIG